MLFVIRLVGTISLMFLNPSSFCTVFQKSIVLGASAVSSLLSLKKEEVKDKSKINRYLIAIPFLFS